MLATAFDGKILISYTEDVYQVTTITEEGSKQFQNSDLYSLFVQCRKHSGLSDRTVMLGFRKFLQNQTQMLKFMTANRRAFVASAKKDFTAIKAAARKAAEARRAAKAKAKKSPKATTKKSAKKTAAKSEE